MKKVGHHSLKRILLLFIVMGTLIQLGGVWLQFSLSTNSAMQAARASQEQLFMSLCDAVDAYIERKEATAFELVFSDQLEDYAVADHLGRSRTHELVRALLNNQMVDGSVVTAQLALAGGSVLRSGDATLFITPTSLDPFFWAEYSGLQYLVPTETMLGGYYIIGRMPILADMARVNSSFVGALYYAFDMNMVMNNAFGSIPWAIADESGIVLCSEDSGEIWQKEPQGAGDLIVLEGQKLHLQQTTSGKLGLHILSCYEDKALYSGMAQSRRWAVQISLLVIACSALTALMLYRSLLAPVEDMVRQIVRIKYNDAQCLMRTSSCDEFKVFTREINGMLFRLRDHARQEMRMQQEIYETGMRHATEHTLLLQSQINPHFLYNNLECICGMVMSGNERAVRTMCTEMAFIYRYGTRGRSLLSTVGEEIRCAKRYERIVKLRFGEGVDFSFEADEEVLGAHIPRMTLQPLLENAVLHGYAVPEGACPVYVRVWHEDGHVHMVVEDRGCGMDDALLAQLNADLAGCSREQMLSLETDRIGVINICCRLLFMFGDGVSMSYERVQPCGTRVHITYSGKADKRLIAD